MRRLGGTKAVPVDFRLISSTNRSPEVALRDGSLRQDLYFRINTVTITVPALRERREDMPILVRAFLDRYRAKHARPIDTIAPEAYRRLLAHSWPGNVRELQHAIERASILKALESTRWNKQAAAALLGLRRPTLYSKMRKHGIPQRPG